MTKPRLFIAAEDKGTSRVAPLKPFFTKVTPLLEAPFQKGLKLVPPATKTKLFSTLYSKVNLGDKPLSAKNKKMLRDILVQALRKDMGWLEFVAENILDGSIPELTKVIGGDVNKATAKKGKPKKATVVVTAKLDVDAIFDGNYPELQDIEASDISYPVRIQIPGQSDTWARVRAISTKSGLLDGNDLVFSDADDVATWFDDAHSESYGFSTEQEKLLASDAKVLSEQEGLTPEEWFDKNLNEYLSDVHDPAFQVAINMNSRTANVTKTAGRFSVESIADGSYPEVSDIEAAGLQYPIILSNMGGNSDVLARLRASARDLGMMRDINDLVIGDSDALMELFDALEGSAWEYEKAMEKQLMEDAKNNADEDSSYEEWFDENYNEYLSDVHDPAIALVQMLVGQHY